MIMLNKSILVQFFGFPATLVHGDTLVLDRWRWLKKRLPVTRNKEKLLDVGCGSGAFTIGAALRGYDAVGLSWDKRNQDVALERAKLCRANRANFSLQDVRDLDQRLDLREKFDFVVCCEIIEHVLNDRKLMIDIFSCLKPDGILLVTTPYFFYRPMNDGDDMGPFSSIEDGRHVRRGYTRAALSQLCAEAGFLVEEFGSCSGFLSQKITKLLRTIRPHALIWVLTFPLRILPLALDRTIAALTGWTDYSICLVAQRPGVKVQTGDSSAAEVATEPSWDARSERRFYTGCASSISMPPSPARSIRSSRRRSRPRKPGGLVRRSLEVADIFRDKGPAWRIANAGYVSIGQLKVMCSSLDLIDRCCWFPKRGGRGAALTTSWDCDSSFGLERRSRYDARAKDYPGDRCD